MKKIKKENMIIIIAAIIMVILIVLIVVFTMKAKNKDNKEGNTTTSTVQETDEKQYWLLTDKGTGVTTSTPGWSTEDTCNGTPWSEAITEKEPYVWYYTTKGDEVVIEPCIWYEYEETSTTEDVAEEEPTTEITSTEIVSGNNDVKEDEDEENTQTTQSSNNGSNSGGNGGNNSSQQSGHDGNTGSNNGGQNVPSTNPTPSTPTTEAPATTEAPSTTEVPVHEHEWVEVWGKKEVLDYSSNYCKYCGWIEYNNPEGITIGTHCDACGGVWTHEELKDKDSVTYNRFIGRPKGSNYACKDFYKTIDAILYYECDCGSIKPAE